MAKYVGVYRGRSGAGSKVQESEPANPSGDAERGNPVRDGRVKRRRVRLSVGALACGTLVAAGLLTHFCTSASRLASADQSLMRMQRMGPPTSLQAAYEQLNSGSVAIRDFSAGPVVATGIYMGSSLEPARLPAFSSFLPASIKRMLQISASHTYAAVFVAPLRDIRTRTVFVDTSTSQLHGVVIKTSEALGLAAIVATADQSQLSVLDPPPTLLRYPLGNTPLQLLILRRDPDYQHRSAGFLLTSGGLRAGKSWCNVPVSGADSGAPLGYVSPSGSFSLAGLAMPSSARGQCSILGAWDIGELVAILDQPNAPRGSQVVPYLGVNLTGTAGTVVKSVVRGSPASAVGLTRGDVILRVGAKRVSSLASLRAVLRKLRPDTIQQVTFVRDKTAFTIPVMLAGIPAADESH